VRRKFFHVLGRNGLVQTRKRGGLARGLFPPRARFASRSEIVGTGARAARHLFSFEQSALFQKTSRQFARGIVALFFIKHVCVSNSRRRRQVCGGTQTRTARRKDKGVRASVEEWVKIELAME